jgi:hypothetical protein
MKNQLLKQPTFIRSEIYFSEIEFFNRDEVTLIGLIETPYGFDFAQYITHKRNLYQMLKHSGKLGQEIIQIIVDAFNHPHEVPVKINMEEIFGKPVCLHSCELKLDRSFYENEDGELKIDYETNLFFIDLVKPIPHPKKQSYGKQKIAA